MLTHWNFSLFFFLFRVVGVFISAETTLKSNHQSQSPKTEIFSVQFISPDDTNPTILNLACIKKWRFFLTIREQIAIFTHAIFSHRTFTEGDDLPTRPASGSSGLGHNYGAIEYDQSASRCLF